MEASLSEEKPTTNEHENDSSQNQSEHENRTVQESPQPTKEVNGL